jgi:type IV fimbrial biogenesis protein FimT
MLMATHRTHRGFSLIELSVVVAVIALLLLAVTPSLSEWARNLRVRNATESVLAGLQKARSEALRRNQSVSFWLVSLADERTVDNSCALSTSSGSWVISQNDPSGACATAPDPATPPMIVDTHAAGDGANGVTVAATAADGTAAKCVRFNGFGQVVSSSALPADDCRPPKQITQIDLSHVSGARNLRIMVSQGGGARMCDPLVTSATDPRLCPP